MKISKADRIMNRLKDKAGETLTETLVAVLVMSLAMIVISGSIVTAAKINDRAANMDTATVLRGSRESTGSSSGSSSGSGSGTTQTVGTIIFTPHSDIGTGGTAGTESGGEVKVNLYTDHASGTDYYFYEIK